MYHLFLCKVTVKSKKKNSTLEKKKHPPIFAFKLNLVVRKCPVSGKKRRHIIKHTEGHLWANFQYQLSSSLPDQESLFFSHQIIMITLEWADKKQGAGKPQQMRKPIFWLTLKTNVTTIRELCFIKVLVLSWRASCDAEWWGVGGFHDLRSHPVSNRRVPAVFVWLLLCAATRTLFQMQSPKAAEGAALTNLWRCLGCCSMNWWRCSASRWASWRRLQQGIGELSWRVSSCRPSGLGQSISPVQGRHKTM